MDHTTNYRDTFIVVSADCPVGEGTVPPKPGTVAAMQHERLMAKPYSMTSDDLLFGIFADRNEIAAKDRAAARAEFFSKGQPCMRSSPLVKTYGWGMHHDDAERVAIYPLGSPKYAELARGKTGTVVPGMRSRRG